MPMSILQTFKNTNKSKRWLVITATLCATLALCLLLYSTLWTTKTEDKPKPYTSDTTLHPYIAPSKKIKETTAPTPKNSPPQNTPHIQTKPPVTHTSQTPLPPELEPIPLPPKEDLSYFDPPQPTTAEDNSHDSENQPDMETFSEDAINAQNANIGPKNWMAQLPEEHAKQVVQDIKHGEELANQELDKQERQNLLHDHLKDLVTRSVLSCAHHNLHPRARCVVQINSIILAHNHGRLNGITATANIHAGGKDMISCLEQDLEGRHFTLHIEDTNLYKISIPIGH